MVCTLIPINEPLDSAKETRKPFPIIKILGSKCDKRMQDAIQNIVETSSKTWLISREACAGALGIHANIRFAEKEIINNDDYNKTNLYNAIKDHPRELCLKARSIEVTKESFQKVKNEKSIPSAKTDTDAAVRFLFMNCTSYRHTGSTFDKKMNVKKYYKTLDAIYPLHQRLKNTQILEMDIFKLLKKIKGAILYIFAGSPLPEEKTSSTKSS